jgi:hypothetical protein
MPATDWGRLDNQPYMPANDFKAMITGHAIGIAKGLEASMNPVIKGGAKVPKKSSKPKTKKAPAKKKK